MQVQIVFVLITLLKTVLSADTETSEYVIPLSINPIVQPPIELSGLSENFYKQDPDFYSSVTLTDVSHDTRQDLKEIVPKKLSVILFTVASSYIGGTLKKSDLKYLSRNRWSYSITVVELMAASEGSITKLDQELELYVFQELGMKFLERRYNFSMNVIQNELGLSLMEFFGASEEQWIKIVGFITEQMINRRSEELSLTPCYLAKLLNKTLNDALAFTLNEVDEYIYNISSLQEKLPQFQETILATTFNVTSADIAILSGLNITVINLLGLRNQIKHLTKSILDKFHLSTDEISTKYKRSRDDILIPCVDEWKWFQTLVVQEAFEKQATNMSLANKTLASLIQIPYPNISKLSLDEIEHLIDTTIREVKGRKDTIEQKKLNMLIGTGNQSYLINLEETTFSVIEAVTNFSKSELTLIYGWADSHYLFAKMFSVADLIHSCSSELHNYTLLQLARINAGEDNDMCTTFSALRNIWEKATINHLEKRFGNHFSNFTIESILLSLTGANLTFINRVLNLSADARALCANVTLDHISIATSRPIMHIKQVSFQYIINLAEELKANGTLFPMRVTTTASPMISRVASFKYTSIHPTATIKTTETMMETRNITHTVLPHYSSPKDINEATRPNSSALTTKSVNFTIQQTNTNKATRITNSILTTGSVNFALQQNSTTDTGKATRITNTTLTTGSPNFSVQQNSTKIQMSTTIDNSIIRYVGSSHKLFTEECAVMLVLFSSMYHLMLI